MRKAFPPGVFYAPVGENPIPPVLALHQKKKNIVIHSHHPTRRLINMSEYPGQELSIDQLFHAVNTKILERAHLCRSSVPEPDQERWVSISVV